MDHLNQTQSPLRVDFAGGWLDVPRFSRPNAYIVNCAIQPFVSLSQWPYHRNSGLGGSAAWAMLNGNDGLQSELSMGVGWQDPAVIYETGLCVWRSGSEPILDFKRTGKMLKGKMALYWTGKPHNTPLAADIHRDFDDIQKAGDIAREAVLQENMDDLARSIRLSYQAQLAEGMRSLPHIVNSIAWKYCGGGWGGYALYLFSTEHHRNRFADTEVGTRIEPYLRNDLEH